jgi:hypothetical protein
LGGAGGEIGLGENLYESDANKTEFSPETTNIGYFV